VELDLRRPRPVPGLAEGLRAGHQDDLRRAQEGPRARRSHRLAAHPVGEPAAAALSGRGRRSMSRPGASAAASAAGGPAGFVALAERLADSAGAIVRRYFRSAVEVVDKPDLSPVTIADREAEAEMRRLIRAAHPDHGIIGEEHGAERPDADWVWVLDPIDGTKSFVTGRPLFGTLIALCHRGRPVLGVIDHPALGERWLGVTGAATTMNGKPVRVRGCADLGHAALFASSPHQFHGAAFDAFERVRRR